MSALPDKKEETPDKTEYAVTVLRRAEITTYAKIGQPVDQVRVTYVAAGLAPATLTILKDEWTIDLEKEQIREEIERRLKLKAEAYKV